MSQNGLSAYEIATSFKDECHEYVPKLLKYYRAKALEYYETLNRINDCKYPDKMKDIMRLIAKGLHPQREIKLYEKYEKVMKYLENIDSKDYNVTKAKEKKIQDLFDFSKKIENTKTIKCCCPFHKDKTPSFFIYKDSNSFYCFSCGEGGDVIHFYMNINKTTFVKAVKGLGG